MEKRYLLWLAMSFILLFAAFLPTSSVASKTGRGNLEAQATHILVGRVKAVESRWNEEKTFIYSHVTVTVEKVLKGTVKNNEILVRHLGGVVGAIGQWTEHEPSFKRGEKVKLYLKQEQDGVYTVVGGEEGKQTLEAKEVQSPGYAFTGKKWPVTSMPVLLYVNLAGSPTGALNAVLAAFQTWIDDPGSYMSYTYAGTTTKTGGQDYYNVVYWGYIDGAGGIQAVCSYWWTAGTNDLIEFDIKLDSGEAWQIWEDTANPNSYDVQDCVTHEAGHSLGLDDLYNAADIKETMYGWVVTVPQTHCRTLYTGDLAGLNVLYPAPYNLGVAVYTDKTTYRPGWAVQVSPRVTSKAIPTVVNFWFVLVAFGQIFPILYVPGVELPYNFDMVVDFDITTPNLGPTAFPAAWAVVITNPTTGDWLAWNYCLWNYSPAGRSTGPVLTLSEFAAQIANSTSLPL